MNTAPPSYLYSQAGTLLFAAFLCLGVGVLGEKWQFLLASPFAFLAALGLYAYLGWWRRAFGEMHQLDGDPEIPQSQLIADRISQTIIDRITAVIRRGQR